MMLQVAGGIGLFLLGMILLTDGIKSLAGPSLRRSLGRIAGNPLRAFLVGLLVTMVVQSSSATTLTVIGFVNAGLLTFTQAVSMVIGASLGTTGTGWLVSVLGLQFSIGAYAFPLVIGGALLRLLAPPPMWLAGMPLAGFGLVFVGIDTLQQGMAGAAGQFALAQRQSGLVDNVLLLLSGAALTILTQSSSAATATILTALHAGGVHFEQAAWLVVGAAVGTTPKSMLASIGASAAAKRTAISHVAFNAVTALIAVLMMPGLLALIRWGQQHGLAPGAISLAAFHTAFIGLGTLICWPLVGRYSAWLQRLVPDGGRPLTRHLDPSLLNVPDVALEASRQALSESSAELLDAARRRLAGGSHGYHDSRLDATREAILAVQQFLADLHHAGDHRRLTRHHVAQIHAIDHLLRFESSLRPPRVPTISMNHRLLAPVVSQTEALLERAAAGLRGQAPDGWQDHVTEMAQRLADRRRAERPRLLQDSAVGDLATDDVLTLLDTVRWLDRLGYHTWRIVHYLGSEYFSDEDSGSQGEDALDEPDPQSLSSPPS